MVRNDGYRQRPQGSSGIAIASVAYGDWFWCREMTDIHHAFTISGGPFGPIPGTHVFSRSSAFGETVAKLLETTAIGSDPYTFSNVNVDPGGYYRGGNEIVLPIDLPAKQREGMKQADTWNGLLKGVRALRDRSRLELYHEQNPTRKGERNRERSSEQYLTKKFAAVDFEGQDYLGNVIDRPNGSDTIPYDDHRLFMGGAALIDKSKPPEWLVNPDSTDDDKKPLDPRAVLEWLVSLPEKFDPIANQKNNRMIFVMYSFSYDVTHILRHLRFEKAWEVFKEEKYNKDRTKRRKIKAGVLRPSI
jgi:hypothetical protein